MNRSVLGALTTCTFRLLFPFPVSAQAPEIARNGVVNAAGSIPSALAGNRIARGALLTVTGTHLGSPNTVVKISGSWGSTVLPVVSASPTKISTRLPPGVSLGPAALTVTSAGQSSSAFPVKVVASQFGIFSLNGKGWGPGSIQNIAPSGNLSPNSVSNPAVAGQSLLLSGSGLGDAASPQVYVGGQSAKVITVRKAGAQTAPDQIAFKLPANAPEGCFVPVQIRHAGELPSNIVTISIHSGGGDCSVPGYFPFAGWSASRAGLIVVSRTSATAFTFESIVDRVDGSFVEFPKDAKLNPYILLPPPGSCTVQVELRGEEIAPSQLVPLLTSRGAPKLLDAGTAFNINDGKIQRKAGATRGGKGFYGVDLTNYQHVLSLVRFLSPAELHVSGAGGADVGRFQFVVRGPEPFEFTLPESRLSPARGLTITWSGMTADHFAVVIANFVDPASDTRGMCYCAASPGVHSFTISPAYLAYFPGGPSPPNGPRSAPAIPARGSIIVASWPLHPVTFQAPGLDHGFAASVYVRAARLDFR